MLDRTHPGAAARPATGYRRRHAKPARVLFGVLALLFGGAGLGSVLTQPNSLLASSSQLIVQDTSAAVVWSAGWKVESSRTALGGTIHYSSTAGASASLIYYGSYMKIIGPTGHGAGDLRVTVDGQTSVVSTHGAVFQARQVIFGAGPTGDRHVLTFQVVGSPGHPNVAIDAFVISAGTGTGVAPGSTSAPNQTPAPTAVPAATNPPVNPVPPGGPGYGAGIGADSLANTQIGGSLCQCTNNATSYRFRATQSSSLKSIMIYAVYGSGYSGGTGGTISVSVQTDDGSASHAPTGTVLASASLKTGNPGPSFPVITFSSPASLSAGQLYHIVFKNADSHPTSNFISVNSLYSYGAALSPQQPRFADSDWGQLMSTNGSSGWQRRTNFTPILDMAYANGVHAGLGYMEVWVNEAKTISGSSAVRETFTPTSGKTVSSALIRVSRRSGSSPLGITLETAGGTVLATGSISAGAIGTSAGWATTSLSSSVDLVAGRGYLLVFTAPSGTAYSAFSIEHGINYKFPASEYFSDGYAQFTTGSGWAGFTDESGDVSSNSDLQFYLK